MKNRLDENDVRLMRQELLAREEGRVGDAQLIRAYLVTRSKLRLEGVRRKDVAFSYLQYWGVPSSIEHMIVLLDYGNEPVYRIPRHLKTSPGPVGTMEIPMWVPEELKGSIKLSDEPPVIEVPARRRLEFLRRFLGS